MVVIAAAANLIFRAVTAARRARADKEENEEVEGDAAKPTARSVVTERRPDSEAVQSTLSSPSKRGTKKSAATLPKVVADSSR